MSIQTFKPVKEGKVREVYDNGDSLIIVATDRISAFDVILKNKITDKGAIREKRYDSDKNVRVLVRFYKGYFTEPYDFNGCKRYARIFPE